MEFKKFLGNEKVKNQIISLIDSKRLPQAIVIEGDEGIGKKTFAREIATSLVCRGEEKPCYCCAQCNKSTQFIHPDIFEYCAEGGPQSFHVDIVRKVRNDVFMPPNEAENKIYILGNCQCMNASAQNAILKILEEPPEYAIFILTVNNKSSLLETVLSRSVVFSLCEVDTKVGAKYISENIDDIDFQTAFQAVCAFNGNIGKAIQSINDEKIGKSVEIAINICYSLMKDSEFDLLCSCSVFEKNNQLVLSALKILKSIFRDALVCNNSNILLSSSQDELVGELSAKFSKAKLIKLIDTVDGIKENVLMNANNALVITKICYSLRRAVGR